MKTIEPVNVWFNGSQVQASVLDASVIADNLKNSATFNYVLLKKYEQKPGYEALQTVVNGMMNMTGEAYDNWQTNEYAFDWVAQQLNLTITGDYVRPVPPAPEPEPEPEKEPSPEEQSGL